VNREELVNKLGIVGKALAGNNMIPVFTNFVFTEDSVSAYDGTVAIVGPCKVTDSFAVHGTTLLGLLSNSLGEVAELKLKEGTLTVKVGRSTFKLPTMDKDQFLFEAPTGKWDERILINDEFAMGLQGCLSTVSKDQSMMALTAVRLTLDSTDPVLYSCDGDAITKYWITDGSLSTGADYLLPGYFCEQLVRVMKDTKAEKGTLFITSEWAKAEFDSGYTVYGRMVEGNNPLNHEELLNETMKEVPEYVEIPAELDAALTRARILADKTSAPTKLEVKGNKLTLTTNTPSGDAVDTLNYVGSGVTAHVNPGHIQRALGNCREICIMDNCVVFSKDKLIQLISNMNVEG
jgi:DNA polymerase III sliding clamp (beta) subunit (PCNA family)